MLFHKNFLLPTPMLSLPSTKKIIKLWTNPWKNWKTIRSTRSLGSWKPEGTLKKLSRLPLIPTSSSITLLDWETLLKLRNLPVKNPAIENGSKLEIWVSRVVISIRLKHVLRTLMTFLLYSWCTGCLVRPLQVIFNCFRVQRRTWVVSKYHIQSKIFLTFFQLLHAVERRDQVYRMFNCF